MNPSSKLTDQFLVFPLHSMESNFVHQLRLLRRTNDKHNQKQANFYFLHHPYSKFFPTSYKVF